MTARPFHVTTADIRPRILDLFCCQGGAGEGYRQAGFDVLGVDIDPQPRNPHEFRQGDALEWLRYHMRDLKQHSSAPFRSFDAIHASPPCQGYSNAQRIQGREHPKLIEPLRELLIETGLPYVIENVPGAPLIDPVTLCGSMFGLRLYRHRLFESNAVIPAPRHPDHVAPQVKMGRPPQDHEFIQPVGNFSNVALAREVMGMPWANRDGLREAIPPAYTKWVGKALLCDLAFRKASDSFATGRAA